MSAVRYQNALTAEERTLPLVAYVLLLLSIVTGATAVLAAIVAIVCRREASPVLRSHYDFIVQTFWVSLFSLTMVFALAALWWFMGYAWLPDLARLLFLFVSLWVMVRASVGILRLIQSDGLAETSTLGIPARLDGEAAAA